MSRLKHTSLRVPSYKLAEYYNDVARVMTTKDIIRVACVTPQTVHYACRMGYLVNYGQERFGLYSTANVFDWVRKKYGQVALQNVITAWYAESALKREKQPIERRRK